MSRSRIGWRGVRISQEGCGREVGGGVGGWVDEGVGRWVDGWVAGWVVGWVGRVGRWGRVWVPSIESTNTEMFTSNFSIYR